MYRVTFNYVDKQGYWRNFSFDCLTSLTEEERAVWESLVQGIDGEDLRFEELI